MKFGSWTYDGFQLDLRLNSEEGADVSGYIHNGEWILKGIFWLKEIVEFTSRLLKDPSAPNVAHIYFVAKAESIPSRKA